MLLLQTVCTCSSVPDLLRQRFGCQNFLVRAGLDFSFLFVQYAPTLAIALEQLTHLLLREQIDMYKDVSATL